MKTAYLLFAILCISCAPPIDPAKPKIKDMRSLGLISTGNQYQQHEVVSFHDDANSTTCYVLVPELDSEAYSISCVKDEVAAPK